MTDWLTSWRRSGAGHVAASTSRGAGVCRKVFMAYGRDEQACQAVFGFVRSLDLLPLEWETMVGECGTATPYLGDVIRHGLSQAQAAIVLLTPDDEVRLHPDLHQVDDSDSETIVNMQPRPNVLIELGMALAWCPNRTIVVEVGRLRPIADTAGLNTIRLDGSEESLGKLVERLKIAGCPVNDRGADWRRRDRFDGLDAYQRRAGNTPRRQSPSQSS